ncbi:MAG: sarcosine oxidase subunit alpha family protein [Inquilinus sp.]|nr:sarcosine oxidase subunit alpha family protein [Inquilinus sp.]
MSGQTFRLDAGGRIDRSQRVDFRFDGRRLSGHAGDTLASALLANGVHLTGRSFKYHRPRGIVSAGAEEPNALVQLGADAARTDPNLRATQIELFDRLDASSQNRWPSLDWDVGAVTDFLSPLFPAGFYYKTFMWPAGLWRTYEAVIRRAAGLGRAPTAPDPDRYDHCNAHCDVLVVGAGPAGLAAALAAARSGARVILADEQAEMGGALLSESPDGPAIGGKPPSGWVAGVLDELEGLAEVRLLPRTTVFGYYHGNYLAGLERVTDHLPPGTAGAGVPRQRLWKIRAGQVVLATGAIERPLVFAENDRPGIMLAGAVRTYLNRYAVRAGNRAVIVTNNDSAYRTALDLQANGGVAVEAIVDLRPDPEGELPRRARAAGLPVLAGHTVLGTKGRRHVERIRLGRLAADGQGIESGWQTSIDCDLVAVSGGWNPTVHLLSQSRGTVRYDDTIASFVPSRSFQPERSAGACNGAFGLADCLAQGAAAGADAAEAAGFAAQRAKPPATETFGEQPARPLWLLPSDRPAHRQKAFVDQQNDVTAKDLKLAIAEGYRSVEHVKRYTTTGMGTDQGKTGNVNALGIVAGALGATIPEIGVTTFRPPYTPVTFGAIAGRNVGALYAPVRKTPMHRWHAENGAVFENVGQWKRPWYYPRGGEGLHEAVCREVRAVRDTAGIFDGSTLGKIDIRGRDAAEFLNRVYTNAWPKLGIGRCRYGLMLGEDGMVMDDGVTTRLGENHFHMTTTTGGAATVMGWLEEWLQTEWPGLQVHLTSVTDQWAVIAVAGPKSREIVAAVSDGIDFGGEAFPHMAMREGRVGAASARVFRISFSGELGYEVNVPAGQGLAAWQALMAAGAPHGITPYGTETMHVLRAEKGFIIVGQETDGTITPGDLRMDWIVSRKKPDFIGLRSLTRSDIGRAGRKQLVGLLTEDPALVLEEGAQVVAAAELPAPPVPMLGHVTSSYESPSLGRSIALALVADGGNRLGETLYVAMPDRTIPVTVASPVFYDPEGERLHG